MAITCLKLDATGQFASERSESFVAPQLPSTPKDSLSFRPFDEEALKQGDYRDILNLTRVLMHGPKSKMEVDSVIERYAIFSGNDTRID